MTDTQLIHLGTYLSEQDARDDLGVIKDLYVAREIATFSAAAVSRGEDGHVRVCRTEMSSQRRQWRGTPLDRLLLLLFPPATPVHGVAELRPAADRPQAALDPDANGLDSLGALLDNGQSALVVVGEADVSAALDMARLRSFRHATRTVEVDTRDPEAHGSWTGKAGSLEGRSWTPPHRNDEGVDRCADTL